MSFIHKYCLYKQYKNKLNRAKGRDLTGAPGRWYRLVSVGHLGKAPLDGGGAATIWGSQPWGCLWQCWGGGAASAQGLGGRGRARAGCVLRRGRGPCGWSSVAAPGFIRQPLWRFGERSQGSVRADADQEGGVRICGVSEAAGAGSAAGRPWGPRQGTRRWRTDTRPDPTLWAPRGRERTQDQEGCYLGRGSPSRFNGGIWDSDFEHVVGGGIWDPTSDAGHQ